MLELITSFQEEQAGLHLAMQEVSSLTFAVTSVLKIKLE